MSADTKIYTAAEVASAGYSKEEIEKTVTYLTQRAYKAAKYGEKSITHGAIPALLAEIERLTEENLELKRENHLAWSKGHAAGWDCHIVTMQAADLLPKDQKTSSPYQEKK